MHRRLVAGVAAVAVGALCVGATPAHAHTDQILIRGSTLIYQQVTGITEDFNNRVTISEHADSSGPYYVVEDPESNGIFAPRQCTPLLIEQTSWRCPATGISALYVRVGSGSTADPTRTSSITITAPTPATLSGGSATVNAGTSNVTAGPVGGNVIYGGLGGGILNSKNGFIDTVHTCPPANTLEADLNDILIADCAAIPEPPPPPPAPPGTPSPSPGAPSLGAPSVGAPSPGAPSPGAPSLVAEPSAVVAVIFHQPQPVLGRRYLLLTVSVATALTVRAHGSIALPRPARSLPLIGTTARLGAPGTTATLRLRLSRKTLATLRREFARHRRLYAYVQIEAANAATLSSFSLARRIRIVP